MWLLPRVVSLLPVLVQVATALQASSGSAPRGSGCPGG
eukprot:COSAG01_NODE_33373_length_565_cov_0.884120_1_plen_37_part_10